jgi:DNA-binding NtrC family response regulator
VARAVERTLIVEDSRALARTLATTLGTRFGAVRVARSVAEARTAIDAWAPDLIVLDVVLPDGDAHAVLDLVAASAAVPVVVAISGEAEPRTVFDLAQRGVRAFVPKPLSLGELERAIERALSTAPDLEPHLRQVVGHRSLHAVEVEARDVMIDEALARTRGSRRGAARLLDTSRQLLQYLLRRR